MIVSGFILTLLALCSALVSYFIGAIPTGYIFTKYFFEIDITERGSKNIGATNVARVLGNFNFFFLILLIDFAKAYGGLKIGLSFLRFHSDESQVLLMVLSAVSLLIGNGYSPFINFRGGKGVATSLGILFFFIPLSLFIFFMGIFAISFALAVRVDVAVLITSVIGVGAGILFHDMPFYTNIFLLFMVGWIYFRHAENIQELYPKLMKKLKAWRRKRGL